MMREVQSKVRSQGLIRPTHLQGEGAVSDPRIADELDGLLLPPPHQPLPEQGVEEADRLVPTLHQQVGDQRVSKFKNKD